MSEKNGASPLGKLVPGRVPVLVGDVELVLREPVLAKINAAWEVLDDEDLRGALESIKEMMTSGLDTLKNSIVTERVPDTVVAASGDLNAPTVPLADAVQRGIVEVKRVDTGTITGFLEANFEHLVTILRKGLMPLLTKKLASVIAIALDTRGNRLSLATDCPEACDTPSGPAAVSSKAFREWVADELTTNQAVYALEQISEVSGWADLGKRLWKLFAGSFPRTKPAPQLPPADSATSP